MQKNKIQEHWNKFYNKKNKDTGSSFSKFIYKKLKFYNLKKIIDVGCGNGRDSIYFYKKGFFVTGVDLSDVAIKNNRNLINNNLKFKKFNIGTDTLNKKFDLIYSRFFLHAISKNNENKLIKLINKLKKKNTFICFEFRNDKDDIFNKFKPIKHNDFIDFGNNHFRRVINTKLFIKMFLKKVKCDLIYSHSSKNLSIVKKDNPNLTRLIFKTL